MEPSPPPSSNPSEAFSDVPQTPAPISRGISDRELPNPCSMGYERYKNVAPFAQGGGAVLETALDENLGRHVVIKKLLPELRKDPVMQIRFFREARVSAMIQHPATVPVYEIGRDNEGVPYFTMKKVEGQSLQEVLKSVASRDPAFKEFFARERLVDIFLQVARAVSSAHESGVVHRDIKPSNIRVGDYGDVYLMDWGIAKVMENKAKLPESGQVIEFENPEQLDLTESGRVYGTPRYMSPEQAQGDAEVDQRSDIFSLGILLHEMLTERPLFIGADRDEILRDVRTKFIKSPRSVVPLKMIPRELNAICMRALSHAPNDRYQTTRAMIDDLKAYRLGKGVSVQEDTPWEQFNRWYRRTMTKPAWLALAGGLVAGFLIARIK